MQPRLLACLLLLGVGCQGQPQPEAPARTATPAPNSPVAQGRTLFEQGQYDAAMAKFQEAPGDPDSLYYQAVIWARRAQGAPDPTPPLPPSPLPRRYTPPPPPEFKPEELQALGLLEQAVAAQPSHVAAHLAIAQLLEPHAVRLAEQEQAAAARPRGRRAPTPVPTPEGQPDYSPARVVQAYQGAIRATPKDTEAIEGLIRFALRVKDVAAADAAFQELLGRDRERAEPIVRYADFLAQEKRDEAAAIARYREALIWQPEDEAIKLRIADIFLTRGEEHFKRQEYAPAEGAFAEARKYIANPSSPQGIKAQMYLDQLKSLRMRR